jgi:hypothetical protein
MDTSEAKGLVERYVAALHEGRFDAVGELFAEHVQIEWPQSGERFDGKEACIRVYTDYPGGAPQVMGVPQVTGDGNAWVVQAKLRYPDGKDYFTVSVIEVDHGKVVRETDYFAEPFPVPEWRKGMQPA